MDDAPMLRTSGGKRDGTSRSVLVALAERADRRGCDAFPSIADISYRTGWDGRTVQRALRRLEEEKLIVRVGVSKDGCPRWDLSMDLHRPEADRGELEAEEETERAASAERKRRSRARDVTHSESVTVTHSKSVTDDDVTHPKSVTDEGVTDFKSGRHALKIRDTPNVTDFKSGRHALNATRTTLEPPLTTTTREPPGSETPSESPPDGQTTIDGTQGADEPPKRPRRPAKRKRERTPEQQAAHDAADKIAHWWWDTACPNRGISVTGKHRFTGFRSFLESWLLATPPCSKQEVQAALKACGQSWPSRQRFEQTIGELRGNTPQRPGRPTNQQDEQGAGAQLAEAFGD
jgi:hypothetical protein